jgi:hypothetical protein
MMHPVYMPSCDMVFLPHFMKLYKCVERILGFYLNNLISCNVGITEGRDLGSVNLELA